MSQRSEELTRLRDEIDHLRLQLEEAEQTLRAIRAGEVDALLISGDQGERVYTLKSADYPYRVLIEDMSEGALTLTEQGVILYANRRFAEMVRVPLQNVIGSSLSDWIAAADHGILQSALAAGSEGRRSAELSLASGDGVRIPAHLSLNTLRMDGIEGYFCMVVTDLTLQKRNEAIVAAERLARSILEQAAEAILVCDETGKVIRANPAAQGLCGQNPLGRLFQQAFPLQGVDRTPVTLPEHDEVKPVRGIEVSLDHLGGTRHLLFSVSPLLGGEGERLGNVIALTDVTALKDAQSTLQAQLHELQCWHSVTLGREGRVLELKREINRLLAELDRPPRYLSAEVGGSSPGPD